MPKAALVFSSLTHYCLLVSVILLALPHLDGLPWWLFVAEAMLVAWQFAHVRYRWPAMPAFIRTVLAVASLVLIAVYFRSVQNLDAYVTLLLIMHAQKMLELKTQRDLFFVVFIGLFCLGTRFLYIQSLFAMIYVLAVAVFHFFILHTLYSQQSTSLWQALRNIAWLLLKASPLVLVLFFLFPRIPPMLVIPELGRAGVTGFGDTVSPGTVSRLAQSKEPVFRVKFMTDKPPLDALYWRGLVLESYDGTGWRRRRTGLSERAWLPALKANYASYDYQVTMLPSQQHWLFTLPAAYSKDRNVAEISAYVLATKKPLNQMALINFSSVDVPLRERLSSRRIKALTSLAKTNPRSQAMGQQLRQQYVTTPAIVAALSQKFEQGFRYSLNPPLLGRHNADEFLFDTKIGYCEHYANAAAVVLRAAGIPTRLVAGYLGGEQNPYQDYLLVRQLDAHAWLEYWQADSGWQRFDPTAIAAPDRIAQGSEASLRARNEYARGWQVDLALPFVNTLRLWGDSLNYRWSRWFLDYDRGSQLSLITDISGFKATSEILVQIFVGACILVVLPFFFVSLLQRFRQAQALSFALMLADKGLKAQRQQRQCQQGVHAIDAGQLQGGQYYARLQNLWDQVWYQGFAVSFTMRIYALWLAFCFVAWSYAPKRKM